MIQHIRHLLRTLLIVTVLFALCAEVRADEKPIAAPRPVKDAKATKEHAQGAGIFEMIVDKSSGKVKEVFVRSSTNSVLLDADVINTLLQWRFKPNTQSSVKLPVAFTADSNTALYPIGQTIPANPGLSVPFTDPIAPAKLWQWFSEFYGAAGHR
jgi:TonB family protein